MEIVTARQMYVVKSVTNVVSTILDFQTAKVPFFANIIINFFFETFNFYLACTCFSCGTKEKTTCSSTGKCTCKPGYVGDYCTTCDSGYYMQKSAICQGAINENSKPLVNKSWFFRM